ncbi:MAG: ribosome maturation factor RimM [Lachnospiraceae bacterium]|nr:ribosome maturation factor RimM [Lachnospiraceae bacterium]
MEQFFQVGVYTNTHGVRGEIKVFPTTDDPKRFRRLKQVILRTSKQEMTLEIESVRFSKQMVLLKFKGIDNINDIERYKGSGLFVPREQAVPLKKDEYFIADLIGITVFTEDGAELGRLSEVLQTGANDVYVVQTGERELLLPAIADCVQSVDVEAGRMVVHLMEGLLDL